LVSRSEWRSAQPAAKPAVAAVELPEPDLVLMSAVILGMLCPTLLAAGIPARRATRIDPQRTLRQE
jgi:hypothetical protein